MLMKTWSTHRSAFVQATHQLDILGYGKLKSLGVRTFVRSGTFDAGGFTWALVCRFDEIVRSDGRVVGTTLASISLELSKNETGHDVVAMASLRIDEATGTGQFPAAVWRNDKANTFGGWSGSAVAWDLSVPAAFRDHEARYVHADADRLTIHCTVDVLQQDSAVAEVTRDCFVSTPPPPPSISQDLHRLLRGRCMPDVAFVFAEEEGTELPAHKVVLAARSSVFRAQFFRGDMKDRSTRQLKINDMSASTMRALLYFIYTDEQPKPKTGACPVAMAQDLLVAADLYDLDRLRLMCEKTLSENISVDNVMTTLTQTHGRHRCGQLEASCIEFMASNPDVYEAVIATEEYGELERDCGAFIHEVTKKVARRAVARHKSATSSSSTSSSSSSLQLLHPHKSVSRYNPYASVVGRHDFVIENLSALRQRRRAAADEHEFIRSGGFQVGAYEWAIDVYPWVKGEDGKEHIGVHLALLNAPATPDVNVKASACFRINDPIATFSSYGSVGDMDMYVYTRIGQSHGNRQFIALESATSRCLEHGGALTVHCEVQVAAASCFTTAGADIAAEIVVPPAEMAWHLEQLLASGHGSDVKFLVEQSEIRAHRLVIAARSPVLHEAVESAAANGTDRVVRIDDMSAMVFRAMLHFIYTDELPLTIGDLVVPSTGDFMTVAGELLAAACRFRLERMKRLCMNLLAEKVTTVPGALAAMKVATRQDCPELEEYCRKYIRETYISLFIGSQLLSSSYISLLDFI